MLFQEGEPRMAGIVGVSGCGGIGKSALACYFAETYRDHFPDGVIGLRMNDKDIHSIAREFARLDGELLEEDDERSTSTLMQDLFAQKRVLLILDNAEEGNIRQLHPGGSCAVIVTTRDRALPIQIDIPQSRVIDLQVLARDDAWDLLAKMVGKEPLEAARSRVDAILELVGYLPLAVEIVGKTLANRLRRPGFTIEAYAKDLGLDRLKIKKDEHLNVRLCFHRSIVYLEEDREGQALVQAFAMLSVCAETGFSLDTALGVLDMEDEPIKGDTLNSLVDMSLLNDGDHERYIFHPLLQEFARELAVEKEWMETARARHANYFIHKATHGAVDGLTADLDDIVKVTNWMADTGYEEYSRFWLLLKSLFNRLGYWKRAGLIINRFKRMARDEENWQVLAQFQIQDAKYLLRRGQAREAEDILIQLEETVSRIEPEMVRQQLEAKRLTSLGGVYQRQSNFEQAVHVLEKSSRIEKAASNHPGLAKVLNSLGSVYQRLGVFNDAAGAFKESLVLEKALGNQRGEAMVLNSLGGVYQRIGNFKEAAEAFKESLLLSIEISDTRGQAMILNSLGGVYQRMGRFDDAVHAFQQSGEIEAELQNKRGLAMVLNSLGGVYQRMGRFDDAVHAFQQSHAISMELDDKRGLAMVLNSLGGVYQRMGRFDDAVHAFKESYPLLVEADDKRGQAMVLNSLGSVYQRMDNYQKAYPAFAESYQLGKSMNDRRHVAMVCTSWGRAFLTEHRLDQAITRLQEAFHLEEAMTNKRGLAMVTPLLLRALRESGQHNQAQEYLTRALAVAPRNDDLLKLKKGPVLEGVVKRIIPKGQDYYFGFIVLETQADDLYFGKFQVDRALQETLQEGMAVQVELETNKGKKRARRVWLNQSTS